MHTFVGATDAEVDEACRELQAFYCHFFKWVKKERPIEQGLMEDLRQEDLDACPQYTPEKLRQTLVVGKPDEVISRLKSYEAMGYNQYSFWIDNHMSFETKKRTLERFIADVVPAFQ
jgi:alkanesulfonate monooxygenase SsuD/methylene tetrahydromethanopterin reductase-like flavin-dependent oxidoreductase (luciferase family)